MEGGLVFVVFAEWPACGQTASLQPVPRIAAGPDWSGIGPVGQPRRSAVGTLPIPSWLPGSPGTGKWAECSSLARPRIERRQALAFAQEAVLVAHLVGCGHHSGTFPGSGHGLVAHVPRAVQQRTAKPMVSWFIIRVELPWGPSRLRTAAADGRPEVTKRTKEKKKIKCHRRRYLFREALCSRPSSPLDGKRVYNRMQRLGVGRATAAACAENAVDSNVRQWHPT